MSLNDCSIIGNNGDTSSDGCVDIWPYFAIIDVITQEQDRPIVLSKVIYLGSCLLPSPFELEVTIVLYHNRI
jgi:hypothetical protein